MRMDSVAIMLSANVLLMTALEYVLVQRDSPHSIAVIVGDSQELSPSV